MTLANADYSLASRFDGVASTAYLNGTQALVRLLLNQHDRDQTAGMNTAGFVTGYRGSPLGGVDLALWSESERLEHAKVRFSPGLNEDLAATSVWGTQQVGLLGGAVVDGVFSMWYGKGPGVDRSADAIKHGNSAGASAQGGVLLVVGDDHGAKSSSLAHQSEPVLMACGVPILAPANVQEILDYGILGWAMSRATGAWLALKCVTQVIETSQVVDVRASRVSIVEEEGRLPTQPAWTKDHLAAEDDVERIRPKAIHRFARANGIDKVRFGVANPRLAIVTCGKAYGDVREALAALSIDEQSARTMGLGVLKLGLTWPVDWEMIRHFAREADDLIVIEEKRPLVEDQLASILYSMESRPRIHGKSSGHEQLDIPRTGELSLEIVASALAPFVGREYKKPRRIISLGSSALVRRPAFCSGCPHNTSTAIPDGSVAQGGIGCHGMVAWMPERQTHGLTQMGSEGANWIGHSPFVEVPHMFQNMGDGTYFHSGSLAIRAAVASKTSITYKILINGAVAMTGGQPIEGHEELDQSLITKQIASQLIAEGVEKVVVVNETGKWPRSYRLPKGVSVRSRNDLDEVQRELREIRGVSALLFTQVCAAEARRLRKRGSYPDRDRRIFIDETVCEGCGDCSVQSNCIAIEPVETEYGRKRRINQDACNKDYSCLRGYCPSFAVVKRATLRAAPKQPLSSFVDRATQLPEPERKLDDGATNVFIAGIGGTGVVTIGAILGIAAHLDGSACSVLDVTGLAQKNGPVASQVRVAKDRDELQSPRLPDSSVDTLIGCDLVVTTSVETLRLLSVDRTVAVVDSDVVPTAEFANEPNLNMDSKPMLQKLGSAVNRPIIQVDAVRAARETLGNQVVANIVLLGAALQCGTLPVSRDALERALVLNGSNVELNLAALALGRTLVVTQEVSAAQETKVESFEKALHRRREFLVEYQNSKYADRFSNLIERVEAKERDVFGNADTLTPVVSSSFFKLMAYKDEYEVARLWTRGEVRDRFDEMFEPGYKVSLSLAPQMFWPRDSITGRVRKLTVGPWIFPIFRLLAIGRKIRGGPIDFFGRTAHRRQERALVDEYETEINGLLPELNANSLEFVVSIASLPESIRGYGLVKDEAIVAAREQSEILHGQVKLTIDIPTQN